MATQNKKKLTAKQERFIEEYLIDLNATQASIRAGYSEKNADVQGPRLLGNVGIHARIEAAKGERSERTEITQDYVLKSIQEVAERCLQHKPVMIYDREQGGMVQQTGVDPETGEEVGLYMFDSSGANRALENLGKHTGIFEKDNSQRNMNVTVVNRYPDGGDDSNG